jgi:hypothetical protein
LACNQLKSRDFLSINLTNTNTNTNISKSTADSKKILVSQFASGIIGRAVARRLDPDAHQEARHVHYGDVRWR